MTEKKLRTDLELIVSVEEYNCARFEAYRILIQKEFLIYSTLNLLKVVEYEDKPGSTMIAKVWVPEDKAGRFEVILPHVVTLRHPTTDDKPPTHFETNEFTAPFQEIVDTYGVPRYGEVNPGLFAISIFPFLFGVMFGDIGHGGLLLALGIWLVKDANSKKILGDVYGIRYLVLMMGSFAFYSGWIYNEFFSLPWNIFGTCYGHAEYEEDAEKMEGCVYPIGMDPKWIRASNELNYFNSYKMKFAVIIGVTQMTFGIY
jgi:V-type H+-transporting ATPase subunit a